MRCQFILFAALSLVSVSHSALYDYDDYEDTTETPRDCGTCHVNATCIVKEGSRKCFCNKGLSGNGHTTCRDTDECQLDVEVLCGPGTSCFNTFGSFYCRCAAGYLSSSGRRDFEPNDGTQCADVDECATGGAACGAGAACENQPGSYACRCLDGHVATSGVEPFNPERDGTLCVGTATSRPTEIPSVVRPSSGPPTTEGGLSGSPVLSPTLTPTKPSTVQLPATMPPPTNPQTTRPPPTTPQTTRPPPTNPQTTRPPPTNPQTTRPPPTNPQTTRPPPTNPQTTRPPPTNPQTTRLPPTKPSTRPPPTNPQPTRPPPTKPSTRPPPTRPSTFPPPSTKQAITKIPFFNSHFSPANELVATVDISRTARAPPLRRVGGDCAAPPEFPGARVERYGEGPGSTARYSCAGEPGAAARGPWSLVCSGNGTWQGERLACTVTREVSTNIVAISVSVVATLFLFTLVAFIVRKMKKQVHSTAL